MKRHQGLNKFVTLYVNIAMLPLKDALKFPILIYGRCYAVSLKGRLIIDGEIKRGMLIIGHTDPVRSFESSTILNIMGDIRLRGKAQIRRGFHVQINPNAILDIGNMVFIADNITIICSKQISIGDNSNIGNNCVFMDTDFHYVINTETRMVRNCSKPIIIGKNNWIAGYNVIKKGAVTPEGTIVAGPYSMIGKDYTEKIESYSIIGGSPAKFIASNYRRIKSKETQLKIHRYYKDNQKVYQFPLEQDLDSICLSKND